MTLVPTDESKDTLENYEELWSKIRDLIRSIINSKFNNSNNYDEKCIKLNWDDHSFLKKTLQLSNMIIAVWSVFMRDEGSKYYPQVLYKLVEYYVNVRTW